MHRSQVRTHWRHGSVIRRFRSAVSLHSHTLYSRELLEVIPRVLRKVTFQTGAPAAGQRRGPEIDVSRLWWTPPLGPRQAWLLERRQIEAGLDCQAFISLTDHDSIEAPLMLRVLEDSREAPISVEWTIPFGETFFHLGVHNMAPCSARSLFAEMGLYTKRPSPQRLKELLAGLHGDPAVLIVLNHPLWDEKGIGRDRHRQTAERLLHEHRGFIHALELNGFRRQRENLLVEEMAAAWRLPVVSGGDRHGREPNANVNLTNAGSFEEFVDEVRNGGYSDVLWMSQCREDLALRFLRAVCDVVRDDPQHGLGWSRWNDRVFYRCDDGVARPLSAIWGDRGAPPVLGRLVGLVHLLDRCLTHPRLRAALRPASPGEEEAGL